MQPEPSTSPENPAQQIYNELIALERRDRHLWRIALLVAGVMAAAVVTLVAPHMLWSTGELRVTTPYLRQIVAGFVVLIVLFNAYLFEQRRAVRRLRCHAMEQLLRANEAEAVSQIDPLTETFNRRFLHCLLEKETSRASRMHTKLVLIMIDVDDFKSVNTRFGHPEGDRVLRELAQILKSTFRASDFVVRYGGDEFVVVLTDTDPTQLDSSLIRLHANVDRWNRRSGLDGWKLRVSCGSTIFRGTMSVDELLSTSDDKMYRQKEMRAHA
jgi:diguanylate cyclase (GGDEF)-like protein